MERPQVESKQLPFVAPCNKLPLFAAFHWLRKGWQDFTKTPGISLIYGSLLVLISYILAIASWYLGGVVLLFSLLSGLVFLAPVLALGLYSVSCQLEAGQKPRLGYCLGEGKRHLGDELIFSVILLVVFLVWIKAGTAIHIFFPVDSEPELADFLIFYALGSGIGAVFAAVVFCCSAFALPMMMDRQADAVTAVITSIHAVLSNKPALFIWVLVILVGTGLCFATAFLAMPVIMPLLGYATWHGYRQIINAEKWPELVKLGDRTPSSKKKTG